MGANHPIDCTCKSCKRYLARLDRERDGGGSRSRGGHSGGWQDAEHGYIENKPVTFALGWGSKEGEVLLADGHIDAENRRTSPFWKSGGHNHYGRGQGPNANVKDRGMYSGPGA